MHQSIFVSPLTFTVRSLLRAGSSLLWTPVLRPLCWSNAPAQGEESNWYMYMYVCTRRNSYSAPPLGVAYSHAKDWHSFGASQSMTDTSSAPARGLPHLSASAQVSAANTLALLINSSATITVYRGHRRTFFLPGINSTVHHVHRNYRK